MSRWSAMLLLSAAPLAAQAPPGTDIHLVTLTGSGASLKVGKPVNITARPGYDNQPSFSPDGTSIYYTRQGDGQTDIFRYDISGGKTLQVTATTPESEYSPTVMPDGKHFSVIRVERDSTQRLWAFGLDGTADKPLLDSIKPVGYHAWLNRDTVFVFVLGNPATLREAELAHGTARILASNIGRALTKAPGSRAITYVQQDSANGWVVEVDPVSGVSTPLVRLAAGAAFVVWTPSGDLLTATGNRLLRWRRGDADWTEAARFDDPALQQLSRLALSPKGDRLALVSAEAQPPRAP